MGTRNLPVTSELNIEITTTYLEMSWMLHKQLQYIILLLCFRWNLYPWDPFYMLSTQGPNVEVLLRTIREIRVPAHAHYCGGLRKGVTTSFTVQLSWNPAVPQSQANRRFLSTVLKMTPHLLNLSLTFRTLRMLRKPKKPSTSYARNQLQLRITYIGCKIYDWCTVALLICRMFLCTLQLQVLHHTRTVFDGIKK